MEGFGCILGPGLWTPFKEDLGPSSIFRRTSDEKAPMLPPLDSDSLLPPFLDHSPAIRPKVLAPLTCNISIKYEYTRACTYHDSHQL